MKRKQALALLASFLKAKAPNIILYRQQEWTLGVHSQYKEIIIENNGEVSFFLYSFKGLKVEFQKIPNISADLSISSLGIFRKEVLRNLQ